MNYIPESFFKVCFFDYFFSCCKIWEMIFLGWSLTDILFPTNWTSYLQGFNTDKLRIDDTFWYAFTQSRLVSSYLESCYNLPRHLAPGIFVGIFLGFWLIFSLSRRFQIIYSFRWHIRGKHSEGLLISFVYTFRWPYSFSWNQICSSLSS